MKTTEYLYGIKPEELGDKMYWDALEHRITNGMKLFKELYTSGRDQERCFWVNKAIEHTRELLRERDERE